MKITGNEFTALAKELKDIQDKVKFLKGKEQDMSKHLRERCDNETTSFNGYTYTINERIGSVKYKDIPELEGLDLDQYRGNPVITWKLVYEKQFDL